MLLNDEPGEASYFFFCLFISLEGAFNMQQFIIKLLSEISRRNVFQNQGGEKVLFIRES